ncbi:MAG: MarR family transcriptional regulator, partial [Candidatus Aenigmatarchaeota archaeon]
NVNVRYLGIILIILSMITFFIMYNFSNTMLDIIDSGQIGSCESFELCPHVAVLNQTYVGYFTSFIMLIIGVFMVILGGSTKKPEPEGNRSKWEGVLKKLTGDEKSVYEKIVVSEGVIFQSDLVEQSGFPKAKVSRILDKMEARGLLERKRRGMANAVVLK